MTGAVLLMAASQVASARDITVWDRVRNTSGSSWYTGSSDSRPGLYEDNEVEPGTVGAQIWDLEAFRLNGTSLSIVAGFDFKNGVVGGPTSNARWEIGDLFIDVNGDAVYGSDVTGLSGNGIKPISNSLFHYDYVVHFGKNADGTLTGGYDIFALGADTLLSGYYRINDESNPYALYRAESSPIGSGTVSFGTEDDATSGRLGGTHYTMEIPMAWLGSDLNGSLFKITEECGNDNLVGRVPDGGLTAMMLGLGVAGMSLVGRRLRK